MAEKILVVDDSSFMHSMYDMVLGAVADREVVHARFIATGEIRSMRPHLNRLKAMGLF